MKIEAKDLENALIEASKKLECSVLDLEYEIIQYQKKGFLGFGSKNVIIEARQKHSLGGFKEDKRKLEDILHEISIQLNKLLQSTYFNIYLVELRMYDDKSVFIRLNGEDAALLIGKEAHRYKALSYLLHNWISIKYKLLVRLEIAQFLENQIEGMQAYLQTVIERIKIHGRAHTKPLDGVLIKIALEKLRTQFPDKYVGIKQNKDQRYIVINDFFKKDE